MIAIVDYKAGNLTSVKLAFEALMEGKTLGAEEETLGIEEATLGIEEARRLLPDAEERADMERRRPRLLNEADEQADPGRRRPRLLNEVDEPADLGRRRPRLLNEEIVITSDAAVIAAADRVVFPGVGAAASAMANLRELGLVDAVKAAAHSGKPFLGICLGMQILFDHTEEDGGVDTLGIFHGQVKRFGGATPSSPQSRVEYKVPEIGWNSVDILGSAAGEMHGLRLRRPDGLGSGGTSLGEYYFVHSYYAEVVPETVLTTEYAGVTFTAMVKKGKLWACQFHPEKSGRLGLALLADWLKL